VWVDAQPEPQPERNIDGELSELRTRVADLERIVAAKDAHIGELRTALNVERARLDRLLADRSARRPWPGLVAWARRIVYGDDRGTGGAA
jgi:hypothetical protein